MRDVPGRGSDSLFCDLVDTVSTAHIVVADSDALLLNRRCDEIPGVLEAEPARIVEPFCRVQARAGDARMHGTTSAWAIVPRGGNRSSVCGGKPATGTERPVRGSVAEVIH
jgi:hypothetical protein